MGLLYTPEGWVDDVTKVTAARMNNIEDGLTLANATPVTSLPASPVDGQEVIYFGAWNEAATDWGAVWHLIFSEDTAKWHFIGGAPMRDTVGDGSSWTPAETRANTAYADLATVGPRLTPPLTGDYLVTLSAYIFTSTAAIGGVMSYSAGGAAAQDFDGVYKFQGAANNDAMPVYKTRKRTLTAAQELLCKYRSGSGATTASFANREICLLPIRVG